MSVVDEAISMWELYRKGTVAELKNIPEEEWDRRPGEGARSIRELARHILEAGAGFSEQLIVDNGAFTKLFDKEYREKLKASLPGNSKEELLAQLRDRGVEMIEKLRAKGDALLSQKMPSFSGEQSGLSAIWFAAAHEMYHRGQLATMARACGLVPAMTQQMSKMGRG
jgi:uncharacterized damage-inducible protein DinB